MIAYDDTGIGGTFFSPTWVAPSASGKAAFAIGQGANAQGKNGIAIGNEAFTAAYDGNIAIGYQAKVEGSTSEATALGFKAVVDNGGDMAIGRNSHASGTRAVAVGTDSTVDATEATAVGFGATATGDYSTALGYGAEVTLQNSTAIGYKAKTTVEGGIALGEDTLADTAGGMTGWAPASFPIPDNSTWKSTTGAVSVGNPTTTRQITGVAAGTEDTDAVNVAQLWSLSDSTAASFGGGSSVNVDGTIRRLHLHHPRRQLPQPPSLKTASPRVERRRISCVRDVLKS